MDLDHAVDDAEVACAGRGQGTVDVEDARCEPPGLFREPRPSWVRAALGGMSHGPAVVDRAGAVG